MPLCAFHRSLKENLRNRSRKKKKKKPHLKKSQKKKSAFTVASVPQKEKDLDIFPGVNKQVQQL